MGKEKLDFSPWNEFRQSQAWRKNMPMSPYVEIVKAGKKVVTAKQLMYDINKRLQNVSSLL